MTLDRLSEPELSSTLASALGLKRADDLFPWQKNLLSRFISGEIPRALDIPTGLGKTAVMAIWLVARIAGAQLPRRLVYVVDRRAVVDQATSVAEGLRHFVDRTAPVRERLDLVRRSLPISTLRGQHVDNREWLEDPAAPAIVVGTVDMVGSRLLFQGYGVSGKMRPYHAALLGVDALVVLDEAHLVPPFERLLERIAESADEFGPQSETRRRVLPPLRLISLSATGRRTRGAPFRLGAADFEHDVARQRLDATKRVTLQAGTNGDALAAQLADVAWKLVDGKQHPLRCIIFCDRRADAAQCKRALEKRAQKEQVEVDTELFVGARRVRERVDAVLRLESLGFLAGSNVQLTVPSFLFATSAGEVGVDLDADCMACDLVNWERMVQRLGRVNRRGDVRAGAEIVVVAADAIPGPKAQRALAKNAADRTGAEEREAAAHEEAKVRRAALKLLPHADGALDASPGSILRLAETAAADHEIAKILAQATTPEPLCPELSRALVDAWAMTSLEDHSGRPDVEPWLRGWRDDEPQTRVVWRTHLPVRTTGPDVTMGEIEDFFAVVRPHASEVLETETREVRDWLTTRAHALFSNTEHDLAGPEEKIELPPPDPSDIVAVVLTRAGDARTVRCVRDLILPERKEDRGKLEKELHDALIGGTLVVDARIGGLTDDGLLDAQSGVIPPTADGSVPWIEAETADGEPPAPTVRFRVRMAEGGEPVSRRCQWRERLRFPTAMSEEGDGTRCLIVEGWRDAEVTEEDRSVTVPELLQDHTRLVEEHARALAGKLGLSRGYEEMLGAAARLHDEGKAAPKWQQAFNAPSGNGVYAKTAGPINHKLLSGYRHELGTVLRILEGKHLEEGLDGDCRDLILHVIAAHHGFARPFIRTSGCDAPPSPLEPCAQGIALNYARLQERWGPWGLAWWEALLRAADQNASREGVARGWPGGV